jgi:hypothetical protein
MKSIMKIVIYLMLFSSAVWSQMPAKAPAAQASTTAPIPAADAQALSELLNQTQAAAQKSDADVARLHIEKWKADSTSKQQAQSSAASIRRNLTNAVPDLIQRIQAAPASLNANFRLYRNLNALYDTFSALAESAGAFGPRDQYDPLATDIARLDQLRHQMAERVDLLAGTSDAELTRLRARLSAAVAAAKPTTPTKTVVDDEKPKPKKKAKPAQKPKPPQTSTQDSTQNSNQNAPK